MKHKDFDFIDAVRDYFKLSPFMPIMSWIEKNINLVDDVSSQRDKPDFSMFPYQVPILEEWEDMNIRKHVVVVSIEQARQDDYVFVWAALPFRL